MKEPNFTKWLIYTVGVGVIPAIIRLLAHFLTDGDVELFYSADLITLGLILHVSIINEIEDIPDSYFGYKTAYNGTSILFITIYGFLLAHQTGVMPDIDERKILNLAKYLSITSLLMGFSLYGILRFGERQNA